MLLVGALGRNRLSSERWRFAVAIHSELDVRCCKKQTLALCCIVDAEKGLQILVVSCVSRLRRVLQHRIQQSARVEIQH